MAVTSNERRNHMGRDRAAYMRDYRARQRDRTVDKPLVQRQAIRIAELEDEIARLKRELAARPIASPYSVTSTGASEISRPRDPAFNSHPFRPVPKTKH